MWVNRSLCVCVWRIEQTNKIVSRSHSLGLVHVDVEHLFISAEGAELIRPKTEIKISINCNNDATHRARSELRVSKSIAVMASRCTSIHHICRSAVYMSKLVVFGETNACATYYVRPSGFDWAAMFGWNASSADLPFGFDKLCSDFDFCCIEKQARNNWSKQRKKLKTLFGNVTLLMLAMCFDGATSKDDASAFNVRRCVLYYARLETDTSADFFFALPCTTAIYFMVVLVAGVAIVVTTSLLLIHIIFSGRIFICCCVSEVHNSDPA